MIHSTGNPQAAVSRMLQLHQQSQSHALMMQRQMLALTSNNNQLASAERQCAQLLSNTRQQCTSMLTQAKSEALDIITRARTEARDVRKHWQQRQQEGSRRVWEAEQQRSHLNEDIQRRQGELVQGV